jgi:hypothetical protein
MTSVFLYITSVTLENTCMIWLLTIWDRTTSPCLVHPKIIKFFKIIIFRRIHGTLDIDKKITNCTVYL